MNQSINLLLLTKRIVKKWKQLVIGLGLGMAAGFLITVCLIPEEYVARVSMYVNSAQKTQENNAIDMSDLNLSKSLVNAYIVLIESDSFLEQIRQEIGTEELTVTELRKSLTCSAIDNTEVFEILVTTNRPVTSFEIADAVADRAPLEIARIFQTGTVEILDHPKMPEVPSAPNKALNTAVGGVIGLFAVLLALVLRFTLSQKIKEPAEFEEIYTIPLLGIILSKAEGAGK